MWDATTNVAPSTSGNNHPRVVTDREGNPMILWYHAERAMFSRWNGSAFETPRILNPLSMTVAGATWMGPDIAVHGDTIYVVFKATPEHEDKSWIIHSYDGGDTFSDPVQIDQSDEYLSRFPTVTTDENGNPIVAFMKFNHSFGEARWSVARSFDGGLSFANDELASGWSSGTSHVCDCCPGSIVNSENTVAMVYRDNNSNVRDTWAGISYDGGWTFTEGMNLDYNNWMIMQCPASGPDAIILGDTLYSVFMNGASGRNMVYFSRASLTTKEAIVNVITGDNPDITVQNFPRIAEYNNAVAVVYRQVSEGQTQLAINFTSDITEGLPEAHDTVDVDNINNADVAIAKEKIYVVWEDGNSGTIKFRSGTYTVRTAIGDEINKNIISVYPNPSFGKWTISGLDMKTESRVQLFNTNGQMLSQQSHSAGNANLEIENYYLESGMYYLNISNAKEQRTLKLMKF